MQAETIEDLDNQSDPTFYSIKVGLGSCAAVELTAAAEGHPLLWKNCRRGVPTPLAQGRRRRRRSATYRPRVSSPAPVRDCDAHSSELIRGLISLAYGLQGIGRTRSANSKKFLLTRRGGLHLQGEV